MKVRAEARFSGKVQQVFFRDYTRRFADRMAISGWVMNCDDGTVRAIFEGEREDILEVVRLLREEHPRALVERVELEWSDYRGEFRGFHIRYA